MAYPPGRFGGRARSRPLRAAFACLEASIRTNVYIDGFNFYYGALRKTPYRWVNIRKLCELLLPKNTVAEIKYFTALVSARPNDPDQPVRQQLYLRALRTVPGLHLVGTAREKAGVISFVLDGCRSEDVGVALDREGIAVRAGHHCAQPALRRFGLESTVRPSLALYNTHEDVDALVAAVRRIQSARSARQP